MRPDSLRARKLWFDATRREADLDDAGAFARFRSAYRADPSWLPAQRALLAVLIARVPAAERRRVFADAPVSPADLACLSIQTTDAHEEYARMLREARDAERRYGATPCLLWAIALAESNLPLAQQPAMLLTHDWPAAVAATGNADPAVLIAYGTSLASHGDTVAAVRALRRALARAVYWRDHLSIEQQLVTLAAARGDTAGARGERERLEAWVRQDGRPRVVFEEGLFECRAVEERCPQWAALLRMAGRRGDALLRYDLEKNAGHADVELGFPLHAVTHLMRATAIADSVGWSTMRGEAMAMLGRAYVKLGRWDDAIRVLVRALPLTDPEDPYAQADVQHNLAHAYEGAGRMTDAVRAVRKFAAYASTLSGDGMTVISLYDAGTIEWEAGLHVAARASFDSMVKVIDVTRLYYFYAGDYYERIGDLAHALEYYRAATPDNEEGARALAGKARVFEALGMRDSADAAARKHDREVQTPDQVPLVPHLLAERGRVNEALRDARSWADSVSARGNLQGAALAELDLAALLAERGSAAAAAEESRRAESLARRANLLDAVVRAQTLQAQADLRLGDASGALRRVSTFDVSRLARVSSEARLGAEVVAGDAAARAGHTSAALAYYDAAARVVERMADVFATDVDRARLHARQMAPFDRAVALLLQAPSSEATLTSLVRWSQRRQGASLDDPADRADGAPRSVTRIQSSLGARQALVDYLLLDSTAAAIVVTNRAARVVHLPTTAADVARLTRVLRERLATAYMGQVDLDRSRVDTAAANALSRLLIRPIAALVRGRPELTIVPDGALHLLPFDLLPTGGGRLVIDDHAIAMLPSARFLPARRSELAMPDGRLLLVAGDAPGAAREATDVRRLWTRGRVDVLPETATKFAAMRDSFGGYSVLHFATHARVDSRDPLGSRLVLGRAGTATLSVGDIEQMRTRANLVVLSACESDGGPLLAGEGPMGLARAFLVSGSRAVLATQWPVGDATADLMKLFYEKLAAGDAPVDALRAAKLALRREPGRGQPFNWAGFVLVGA